MEHARVFTYEQAMAMLPLVRQLLTNIQRDKAQIDQKTGVLDALLLLDNQSGSLDADIKQARAEIETAVSTLQLQVHKLIQTGAELKGIDEGLVDFPSERGGRLVYLCWRMGEDSIDWWHDIGAGFAGRQRL